VRTLSIDIETYSSADLKKCGVYKYTEAHDFTILLFAYAYDDEPVKVIDLASGKTIPDEVKNSLNNIFCKKTAYNAAFERTCIAKYLNLYLPPSQWECTMVKASMLGLPLGLDIVATVLNIKEGKLTTGKPLIRFFSIPCKPTIKNGQRARNLPQHDPDKWNEFKNYCARDVNVERSIKNKIAFFEIPETEKKLWALDQKINDAGIMLDPKFIKSAMHIDSISREQLTKEALDLTGLNNPNSVAQLKRWIEDETGDAVSSLNKKSIPAILSNTDNEKVIALLDLRAEMSKTSIKKYAAMIHAMCKDERARGLIQYYGAGRTGRWAGRLIQVHNLRKNDMKDLDLARRVVRTGNHEMVNMLFDSISDTLSQLIRTAFIAAPNHRFLISDFSAIEARVIAWLAGEQWRLDVFDTHGKIYEASASQMFKVPIESVTKGSDLRQKGKVSELALGYQGGPGALIQMGALDMGIDESDLQELVDRWRAANKKIVQYWYKIQDAAIRCVSEGEKIKLPHGITMFMEKGIFFIELPSGRRLSYLRPKVIDGRFGKPSLTYEGLNDKKKWGTIHTYGGMLVENIVQAIARDLLADGMLRVNDAGYKIAIHVHDEIVSEMPNGQGTVNELNHIMSQPVIWAKGLPLKADSYESVYYKKD
jgi:DNA polymerase